MYIYRYLLLLLKCRLITAMAVIRKAILICFHSLLNNTRSLASISASQNHSPFIYMFQEKIKSFLEMRDRGELLVQKARKLFCNLLKEV